MLALVQVAFGCSALCVLALLLWARTSFAARETKALVAADGRIAALCSRTEASSPRLRVAITGANSGIGFELACTLAAAGARVYLGCRSKQRGTAAAERIRMVHPTADVLVWLVDVADPVSTAAGAAELAAREPRLDALFLNAGIMPVQRYDWLVSITAFVFCSLRMFLEIGRAHADGRHFIVQPLDEVRDAACGAPTLFATHVLGHLMLVHLLHKQLDKASKVIWTGSRAASRAQTRWEHLAPPRSATDESAAQVWVRERIPHGETYGEAKHVTDLIAPALARRISAEVITICPGFVDTEMTPGFFRALLPFMHLVRFLAPGMNITPRRGIQAHLLTLAAAQGSLVPTLKYVCVAGALTHAVNGFVISTVEEQERAYALCDAWLQLWRQRAGITK